MKLSHWALVLFIICIGGLASGCSSPTAAEPPVRIRWSHDPENLEPMAPSNQYAVDAGNLLHCGLLAVDANQRSFAPMLVESMPAVQLIGDSLTKLDYRLRAAATWDNGQPVQARDVEFTLKLMHCPGLANEAAQSQYGFIRAVEIDAADLRHFTLLCRGQAPDFATASGDFPILPEAVLDPEGELRRYSLAQLQDRPAAAPLDSALARVARHYRATAGGPLTGRVPGCGPYELISWEKDRALRFRRKKSWWGARVQPVPLVLQAQAEQLEFLVIPDDATASLALQRGELDVYPQVPVREFARLQRLKSAQGKLSFYTEGSYDVLTAGFNTRRPALADAGTRRALSRLFDAASLLQALQLGEGRRTASLISPSDKANYNDSLALLPFSPTEAAALLRGAGWQRETRADAGWQRRGPGGTTQRLNLVVRYRSDEASFETVALQFRAAAAQLGIPVQLQPTESAALTPALQRGDFDLYVRVLRGNPFLFNFAPILHSQAVSEGNLTGYGTPASDQLIEVTAKAASPGVRARLLRKLQARLQADAPLVPIYILPMRIAAARNLTGLHVTGLKPGYTAATMSRTPAAHKP